MRTLPSFQVVLPCNHFVTGQKSICLHVKAPNYCSFTPYVGRWNPFAIVRSTCDGSPGWIAHEVCRFVDRIHGFVAFNRSIGILQHVLFVWHPSFATFRNFAGNYARQTHVFHQKLDETRNEKPACWSQLLNIHHFWVGCKHAPCDSSHYNSTTRSGNDLLQRSIIQTCQGFSFVKFHVFLFGCVWYPIFCD